MNISEYQRLAMRTAKQNAATDELLTEAALGLCGEAGETAELIKKYRYHGKALNPDDLRAEMGDVLWYLALLCEATGVPLEEVAQANIDKLKARWPDGFNPSGKRQPQKLDVVQQAQIERHARNIKSAITSLDRMRGTAAEERCWRQVWDASNDALTYIQSQGSALPEQELEDTAKHWEHKSSRWLAKHEGKGKTPEPGGYP